MEKMGAEPDPNPWNQSSLKQKEHIPANGSIAPGAPEAHSGMHAIYGTSRSFRVTDG